MLINVSINNGGLEMIIVGQKQEGLNYQERKSSYGILTNNDGQIAVSCQKNWGLIFLGGKIEEGETPKQTIIRETLEEVGYEVDNLKYYDSVSAYYDVYFKDGRLIHSHNLAEFYIGIIKNKIQEPIEPNTSIEWYYPNDLKGKMKLEFQNLILDKYIKDTVKTK